jgi:CBS domain-containing protein
MKVSEAMTREVRLARPDQSIREVAQLMSELDIGAIPVEDNDRLVGMITDRDIAVRAIAEGRGPDTPVRDVMTSDIKYCFDDQSIDEVTRNMGDLQVRRLPVVNRDKRLVGILSLGDLAVEQRWSDEAGEALSQISQPGGPNSQTSQQH